MPGQFSRTGAKLGLMTAWPIDVQLALATSAPGPNALGAEYAAMGYVRKIVRRVNQPTDTDPPVIVTQDPVTFGPFGPTGVGAEVGWVMAFPTAGGTTAADMLMYWELDEHKTPLAGDSLVLAAGDLEMTLE